MKTKKKNSSKARVNLSKIFLFLIVFSCPAEIFAHDIDNLSKQLNVITPSVEFVNRVQKDKPHHCADGVCEGRLFNSCLGNTQVNAQLRTMQDINKNFWHWRRVLMAQIEILAGDAGFARGLTHGKKKIPFINYDPFYLGRDDSFPDVFRDFKKETGLDPYSALEVRYDLFVTPHVIEFPGAGNATLKFKTCGTATHNEKGHAPECMGSPPSTVILVGGDSYKAPSPFRDEDGFVYYDRIPASPIDDACMGWKDKRWTFGFALIYAEAHEDAGKHHAIELFKRVVYIRKIVDHILKR